MRATVIKQYGPAIKTDVQTREREQKHFLGFILVGWLVEYQSGVVRQREAFPSLGGLLQTASELFPMLQNGHQIRSMVLQIKLLFVTTFSFFFPSVKEQTSPHNAKGK